MINACAGASMPTGGGSIDGGSGTAAGAAGTQAAPFGGNFSGPGAGGGTANDAADTGDADGIGAGSGNGGGNNNGGSNGSGNGGAAPGAEPPASLPQSSIPAPGLKKVNIYATDSQGNTPVIGSPEAIDESERDGNHMVVISTEPIEDVVARLEIPSSTSATHAKNIFRADIFRHYFLETSKQLLSWLTGSDLISGNLYAANAANMAQPKMKLGAFQPLFNDGIREPKKKKELNTDNIIVRDIEATDTEATTEDTTIALEEICDGKNTVCCDTIQADGSFECYTKALPQNAVNNANPAPYHLYVLNKTDMKFSPNVDEPINQKLRWFRDVPKDIATVSIDAAHKVYSITNDISLELNEVDGTLRVNGVHKANYKASDAVGATQIETDAENVAYLVPDGDLKGVYKRPIIDPIGAAAIPFKKMGLPDESNAVFEILKNDGQVIRNTIIPDGFLANADPRFAKLYSTQIIVPDVQIPVSDANGCNGFTKVLSFDLEAVANTQYYAVTYADSTNKTCSIVVRDSVQFNIASPLKLSDDVLNLSDLSFYKSHAGGQSAGKVFSLDKNKKEILIGDFAINPMDATKNTFKISNKIKLPENFEPKNYVLNKTNNRAYILSSHPDVNQEGQPITVDLVSVFDLQPNEEAPAHLGDYNLKNAAIPDKDLNVIAEQITFYKDAANINHLVIGTKDLKGAIILPEEQIINANLDSVAALTFEAVNNENPAISAKPKNNKKIDVSSSFGDLLKGTNKSGIQIVNIGDKNTSANQVTDNADSPAKTPAADLKFKFKGAKVPISSNDPGQRNNFDLVQRKAIQPLNKQGF